LDQVFNFPETHKALDDPDKMLKQEIEPMVQRELIHRGIVDESRGYEARLIGWVEIV
jgi:hypothetical protein